MAWLLDTGPLVAFFDRGDRHHEWALEQWDRAPIPLLTCEAVLAEAIYLLQEHAGLNPARVLELIKRGVVAVPFQVTDHSAAVLRLLDKYADQRMQLADACLVRMSEVSRGSFVFTTDQKDFGVYRRFERRVIPLVAPPSADGGAS
jgi:predicted nucleic acid-binding protein